MGSGNHFAELSLDEQQRVWVVLHSGSRGIGNEISTAHIKQARRNFAAVVEGYYLDDPDLAWVVQGTPATSASSPGAWAPTPSSSKGSATSCRGARAHTARAADVARPGQEAPVGRVADRSNGDRTWLAGDAARLVDEHPDAYKSIEQVMADRTDLIAVEHRMTAILNYKG